MTNSAQATAHPWTWWAGYGEEWYQIGPCATREEAIARATDERLGEFQDEADGTWKLKVYLVESQNAPLRLADWIGADQAIERAEESIVDSDRIGEDDGPWFDVSSEQEADLVASLKATVDAWQERHELRFTCRTFSAMRNMEQVILDLPKQDEQA